MRRFLSGVGSWVIENLGGGKIGSAVLSLFGVLALIMGVSVALISRHLGGTPLTMTYFGTGVAIFCVCSGIGLYASAASVGAPSFSTGLMLVVMGGLFGFGIDLTIDRQPFDRFTMFYWVIIAALFFVANIPNYNRLIKQFNAVGRDWNSIRILLQRRLDLIDRLLTISK